MMNSETLRLLKSDGHFDSKEQGKFGDITVWDYPNSLSNILLLSLITENYRMTLDSTIENTLLVHMSPGHTTKITMGKMGYIILMQVT